MLTAQTTYAWEEIKQKFGTDNPNLKAAQASIDESRANETTACRRSKAPFARDLILKSSLLRPESCILHLASSIIRGA
jgi:hypothetical protein